MQLIMKKNITLFISIIFTIVLFSCSTSKNATNLKPNRNHLSGTWIISDINLNVPSEYKITTVFDEAPYSDFKGSTWSLIKNGKGSFTLNNGTKENIYWGVDGKGDNAQFEFKKLNGMKPRNVENGYKLDLGPISSNSFTATSMINTGSDSTGTITYTFTKK